MAVCVEGGERKLRCDGLGLGSVLVRWRLWSWNGNFRGGEAGWFWCAGGKRGWDACRIGLDGIDEDFDFIMSLSERRYKRVYL